MSAGLPKGYLNSCFFLQIKPKTIVIPLDILNLVLQDQFYAYCFPNT